MTPKPTVALDVVDIQVGIASQGSVSGIALRLYLRDGTSVVFALPDPVANVLATSIQDQLRASKGRSSPHSH